MLAARSRPLLQLQGSRPAVFARAMAAVAAPAKAQQQVRLAA